MVAEDDETSKDKEIDKLMALISLSFKKIYKPTNNNLRTSSNTSRANQNNSPRINRSVGYENQRIGNVARAREIRECQKPKRAKDAAYHREQMLLCKQKEAGIQLNAEQADWRDDTDDDELEDQELEAHYMYMAQIQEVSSYATDSGPIFDDERLQKVSNDDHYNVFAMESDHPEQSKSVHDTYPIDQDAHNVIINSLDMSYDREEINQNDNDNDLANEREIEDFKNKNKSLESSNNYFKEANIKLSETNNLLYTGYKKSEAELARRNSMEYASQMEIECTKKPKQAKDAAYHRENMLLCKQKEAGIQLNVEQADWKDNTNDESDDQELEAHYMYMAEVQEVYPDAVDSGPIFDTDPEQKIDQNDEDVDLAKERELLASLIEKLKCKIDESKNRNKFLETSNKANQDNSLRINKSVGYENQRIGNVAGARETVGSTVVQKSRIQCYNCKEFGHVVKECHKLKRAKDAAYHREKMLLYEVTNLQCDYLELLEKCECLETEISKSKMMSKSFESVQKHAINLELELQQCKEKIKNDKLLKANQTKYFCKEHEEYFKIQDLKAQLQDKGIVISKPPTFLNSFERRDFSKSKSVTQNNVSNDFSKPVTEQTLPPNKNSILKNMNVLAPRMYKLHIDHNQARTSQLPQDSRKTNKRVSFSTRVILKTSVSRPQLKINPIGDRVMRNNCQGKKQEVEDNVGMLSCLRIKRLETSVAKQRHCYKNVKLPKNKTSVTACNDSLNAKTLNVKFVSMCDKCVLHDKHDMCVLTSVTKPIKRTVTSKQNKKPRNFTRKIYKHVSKTCSWWYPKSTPSGYIWKPKSRTENVNPNVSMPLGNKSSTANILDTLTPRCSNVSNSPLSSNSFVARRIVLFIVDSECSKHMTGNLKLLINFVEKFLGTVKFGNDQIAPILGYGDLVQGTVTIKRVTMKSTCFIRDLKGNDLLSGSHETYLYSITLQDSNSPNPICLVAKATSSQAWLWHRRLSHLNFDTINLLSKNDIVVGLPK
nr:hypothetical protein [Tanacetum cinerariifolium]